MTKNTPWAFDAHTIDGPFTELDCGCKTYVFCESDGTEYVELRQCKLHKAAPDMYAVLIHDVIELANLAKLVDEKQTHEYMEAVYAAIEKARGEA